MELSESYIYIKGLRLRACHGVLPQERQVGAEFVVDLRAGVDFSRALESDMLTDTLSYADLYDIVRREMETPSALLEHVAGRIGKAVFAAYPEVSTLDIRLTKLNPPMGADCDGAGVEVHYINE